MTFYMIRAKGTRRWYRQGTEPGYEWGEREDGTVWLSTPYSLLERLEKEVSPLATTGRMEPELVRFHAFDFPDLVIVEASDHEWQGLYVNEQLVWEGSQAASLESIFRALDIKLKVINTDLLPSKQTILPADLSAVQKKG